MKNLIFILFLSITATALSQDLNNYKYILVPEKFEDMKEEDQYRLNGLTNFLFNENGFNSVLGYKNLPKDALNDNCLVLTAELIDNSNLFNTKIAIQLKNCKDEIIYTSPERKSREKKYIVAYNEALRASLKDLSNLNYKYVPVSGEDTPKAVKPVPVLEKDSELVNEIPKENTHINTKVEESSLQGRLVAKKIENTIADYQVIGTNNDILFTLLYSGKENVYLVKYKQAILYKKDSVWVLADRSKGDLNLKVLEITFN